MAPSISATAAAAAATAASSAKKYKLFSSMAAPTGEKAPCAFFASPQGCRNGVNCKFSHAPVVVKAASASPNGGGSVVSSESEGENDRKSNTSSNKNVVSTAVKEDKKKKKQKKTKTNTKNNAAEADDNPFLAREEQQETSATADKKVAPTPLPGATSSTAEQPSKWVPLHRSASTTSTADNKQKKNDNKAVENNGNKKETNNNNNNKSKKNRRGQNSSEENSPFVNPVSAKKAARTEPAVKETAEKTNSTTKERTPPPPPQKATTASKKKQKTAPAPAPPPANATTTSTTTFANMANAASSSANTSAAAAAAAAAAGIHPAFGSLHLPVAPFFNSTAANITVAESNSKMMMKKVVDEAATKTRKKPPMQQQQQQQKVQQEEAEALESGEEEEEEDQKPATTKRPVQESSSEEEDSNTDDDNNNNNNSMSNNNDKYLNGVWPESTAVGRKWLPAVRQTRQHFRYLRAYDFDKFKQQDEEIGSGGGRSAWIRAHPSNSNSNSSANNNNNNSNLPAAIAIDCEMCETQDPVSKKRNPRALCRISIVNAENDELLLDSLVKPAWPVVNHRSWINGIAPQHLETVQFTLRHAQAFLMELCTDETVILGHAVHNDLAALQMEHYCIVDSACLFQASDSERATVSLKDLAWNILQKKMPETHDSVNDARVALRCLEHYMDKNGYVETIVRSNATSRNSAGGSGGDGFGSSTASFAMQLFVHRIPRNVEPEHLLKMFLEHSSVEPESVQAVDFPNPSTPMGKTIVTFRSQAHANLAFETLAGKSEPDPSGRLQKKVFMKNGSYIRVRKMAYECKPQQEESQQDSSSPLKRKRSDSN